MKKKILLILLILCMGLIPKVTLAETYDGEYSVDYLLRNYNVVTLGQKDNDISKLFFDNYMITKYLDKKNNGLNNISNIEGAILVNGDYTSVDNSNFAFSSNNIKSFIAGTKGENVTTPSNLVTDSNYVDFEKMYSNVMSESQALADNSEYYINSANIEVSSPGIYTIKNTSLYWCDKNNFSFGNSYNSCMNNTILIKDYDKNDKYVFNIYNDIIYYLPNIMIMEKNSSNTISLKDYITNGMYSGNIIFNFPNARLIAIGFNSSIYGIQYGMQSDFLNIGFLGSIIAPKADVYLYDNFRYYNGINTYNYYCGTFIVNSIFSNDNAPRNYNKIYININKSNYKPDKKIIAEETKNYYEETKDYSDDYYNRDYSIKDLLENYSLVTLGHKAIDSKSKLLQYGDKPGSIKLFHITGQALISGDLYGKTYESGTDDYNDWLPKYDKTIFDLESNKVTESYIKGNATKQVKSLYNYSNILVFQSVIQPWDNMSNDNYKYVYQKNNLFQNSNQYYQSSLGASTGEVKDYLNFDRLYNNVVAEQSAIDEGTSIKKDGKVAHIKVGGVYNIDNINDLDEIVFDNFDEEKDKLTIITIKNEGDINFPLISKDTGNYKGIVTNDYYGKTGATHLYEQDTFVQDSYHGNIIWNVPNATYIKLKENAPFAGHLIAPNADVDTPETHFAGCFIVNSIYGEGNTEAHFYPLTSTATHEVPEYDNLTSSEVLRLNNLRLKRLLGGKASTIETTIVGDEEQFRKDEAKLNDIIDREEAKTSNNLVPIIDILQNPLTKRSILIVFVILTIIGVTLYRTFKKKS